MLTRKSRDHRSSKSSNGDASTITETRSRTISVFSSYNLKGGGGAEEDEQYEFVASPTSFKEAPSTPLPLKPPSSSCAPSTSPVCSPMQCPPPLSAAHPTTSSVQSIRKLAPKRLLQARPPGGSTPDLQSYVDSRRALLQLLREGPGGDVARASPVLQATINEARGEQPIRSRRFAWMTALGGSRNKSRRTVETDSAPAKKEEQTTSLRRNRSVATVRSRKSSGRTQSLFGRRKLSRSRSEDSLGFVNLTHSTSFDLHHRSMTYYSTYEKSREDRAEEERKVWRNWRNWVREKREEP